MPIGRTPAGLHLLSIGKAWPGLYNSENAPVVGDAAVGSFQLFADQPSGIRARSGFEPSGVLPPQREASLRRAAERARLEGSAELL
jgi:hypothetical protein